MLNYYVADDGKSAFAAGLHYGVFEGLNALENIIVAAEYEGKSVTEIKNNAFYGESGIKSITLPATIKKIGNNVIAYSPNLTKITFKGTKAQWNSVSKGENWDADSGSYTVHCTDGDIVKAAE